jgi:hypothetical protein
MYLLHCDRKALEGADLHCASAALMLSSDHRRHHSGSPGLHFTGAYTTPAAAMRPP